jgi:hypothetical protein
MKLKVTVNPNPFISELAVLIQGVFSMNIVIRLKNKKGTVVRITGCTLQKGGNKVRINNLERGMPQEIITWKLNCLMAI